MKTSANWTQTSETELMKLENLERYGRRQNLEFQGVPESENEDVPKLVVEICELFGVKINQIDISIAHRLSAMKARDDSKKPNPPAIIATFISRSARNEIYNNRKFAKTISQSSFPVNEMQKLNVDENLTRARKRLLRRAKQMAKQKNFKYAWTKNGRILIRKDDSDLTNIIEITSENDLCSKL